jgi:hypothetical protein
VIDSKRIDLTRWDDIRVWCRIHVPLRERIRDALRVFVLRWKRRFYAVVPKG